MALTPFLIENAGGLLFSTDPQQVGAQNASDCLNVDFNKLGVVGTRWGSTTFNTTALTGTSWQWITGSPLNSGEILAFTRKATGPNTVELDRVSSGGTVVSVGGTTYTGGALTSSVGSVAKIGIFSAGAITSLVYFTVVDDTNGYTLRKYNGSVLANSTGKPAFVAAYGANRASGGATRLAQGRYRAAADSPSGANGTTSTIFFSDAAATDTYTATSFVVLEPGDGEAIVGMEYFDSTLYVFKQTKYYVFANEQDGPTGLPIFNYSRYVLPGRIMDLVGQGGQLNMTTVGSDGVYVTTSEGIFRINQSTITRISTSIDVGVFTDDSSEPYAIGGTSPPTLSWANERLFGFYDPQSTTTRALVYNPQHRSWLLWSRPRQVASMPAQASDRFIYGAENVSNTPVVLEFSPTTNGDDGSTMNSFYQSGTYKGSSDGSTIFTRWTKLWGTGNPTFSVFTDYGTTDSNAGTVTLGTAPTAAHGYHLKAYKGRLFRHRFESTDTAGWEIQNIEHEISGTLND